MIPILFGVMVLTFFLFYGVVSPRAMAVRNLGPKATPQAVEDWLVNRGYDKPKFVNTEGGNPFDSQFFNHLKSLSTLELGRSDATGDPIANSLKRGAIPSLLITVPAFFFGLVLAVAASLFLVYVRDSAIDLAGIIVCVAMMSVSVLVYVIVGQWLMGVLLKWFPAFGFQYAGLSTLKYVAMPVLIAVIAGLGSEVRLYRAVFLEESRLDYVRTARAKGLSNGRLLSTHVLKNGMIALLTMLVTALPFLIMGSIVLENFFGIPGLGNLTVNAIRTSDFAIVRAVVFIGTLFYLFGYLLTDICYALFDPRIRLQ
jgi:peptide/nickel transport system permease protein